MPQSSVLCGAEPREPAAASLYTEKQNAPKFSITVCGAEPGEPAAARLYPEKQNAQSSVLWSWQDNSEGGGE